MPAKPKLIGIVDAMIEEGIAVLQTRKDDFGMSWVDTQAWSKWRANCLNLLRILGEYADPFREGLASSRADGPTAETSLGTLRAIRQSLAEDLLFTVEGLVTAETFADLLEQAEHLLSNNYFLAAGVLGRAVLEEHLRKLCDRLGCTPTKAKPTISDYNSELYAGKHLNKLEMQHVTAMAAVGNEAAHNTGSQKEEDVERLLRDLRDFLRQHPLS